MQLVVILVVFKPQYAASSYSTISKMFNDIRCTYIVVTNNPEISRTIFHNAIFLQHDNTYYEFGAWQLGLDYICKNGFEFDKVVFANDTFCNHRNFGFIEKLAFKRVFSRREELSIPYYYGHVDKTKKKFILETVDFSYWISTYLFCMNKLMLSAIEYRILPKEDVFGKYLVGGDREADFFSSDMDSDLSEHLRSWLFGHKRHSWRNARPLSSKNSQFMYNKALSILCEKILTVRALQHNAIIVNVDDFLIYKIKLIIMHKYRNVRKFISILNQVRKIR
jgi:hypothetical protein